MGHLRHGAFAAPIVDLRLVSTGRLRHEIYVAPIVNLGLVIMGHLRHGKYVAPLVDLGLVSRKKYTKLPVTHPCDMRPSSMSLVANRGD